MQLFSFNIMGDITPPTPYDEKNQADLAHVDRAQPPVLAEVGRQGSYLDDTPVKLTWKTWMTVFWCCFGASLSEIFLVAR